MAFVAFLASKKSLTVHLEDGTSGSIPFTHPKFPEIAKIMADADESDGWIGDDEIETIRSVIDAASAVKATLAKVQEGDLVFTGDAVLFKGQPLGLEACRRIVEIAQNGVPIGRMLKFLNKVLDNPIESARNELWQFMEASGLPINEDGDFIAYKIVRDDYKDIYTGTFDNSVGSVCEVKPFEVDPDRNNTCSRGLHVCGKDYLPHYGCGSGSRIMTVVVNPAHVVAVPVDYSFHKMRTWKYIVIGEISREDAGLLERAGVVDTVDAANVRNIDNEGWKPASLGVNDGEYGEGDDNDSGDGFDADGFDDDGARRASDDATANLFVKDEYLEQFYPASVADIRNNEPLYVYNADTAEYDKVK